VLRPATADDLDTLLAVQREASLAALAHIFPPAEHPYPSDAVRDGWAAALASRDSETAVAEDDGGRVLGVVQVAPGWLHGLYVVPAAWGTGVADRLHDHAVRRLAERGHAVARLWVLEDNRRARRFYERRGWRPDDTTRVVPYPPHPIDVGYRRSLVDDVS
jgi:putative acetyltransferase